MGSLGIRISNGRYRFIAGPAPIFRSLVREEVMGDDFSFVVGLMPEGRHAVHVTQGPYAFGCRFQKFVGWNEAAPIRLHVRPF